MFYSTVPNQKFLLENRKKLVLQSIQFSGKLKNNKTEYDEYCEQIKKLNRCSSPTDDFLRHVKTKKQSLLSADDWIPLESAILYEKRLSTTYGRNETQNKLNRINLQCFAAALVPCFFIGGNIALCVLVCPLYGLLFIATPFSLLTLGCAAFFYHEREPLLNTLHRDEYQPDYIDGLAFSSEDLEAKLNDTKVFMQSTSCFGLFSRAVETSAPPLAEALVVGIELK